MSCFSYPQDVVVLALPNIIAVVGGVVAVLRLLFI